MTIGVVLITRTDAADKIRRHWLDTYTREQLLAVSEPDWERLRNYEFEHELEKAFPLFESAWCISEWCPYNGIYCAWKDHAPNSVIEETAKGFERDADALRADGYAPERMAAYARHRGRTSSCKGCAVGVWGDKGICDACLVKTTP